jgi:DNA-binding CsgD family transcriptional regulator|tara:strand:+ start:1324 stop:1668 length:345 start_codon:yes stop_codon:yes gene_type:complete
MEASESRRVTIKADTTLKYIQVWNGIFNLTNKELQVLALFIDIHKTVELKSICHNKIKKVVANKLEISDPNTLNNYIKKLKDKGALRKVNNAYVLTPILNPNIKRVEVNINSNR